MRWPPRCPDVFGERRPRVAVIGVLEDKDAAGMLETLLPHFDRVVFTRPANPRSLSPATLVTLAEKLGGPPAETVPEPRAALARARELAGHGRRGARHGLDLPDRRPRARGRRRAGVDALVRRVSAVLFDLDGVLVESRESTERVWLDWAEKNSIEEGALRSAMHGVRSAEVVRALRPDLDAVAEADGIERRQAEDVEGLRAIPGALAALGALKGDRVAVVTSGTRPLALARLAAVGIEPPAVMVFADDVARGKPDPEGYLDGGAPAGRRPGRGAGRGGRAARDRGGEGGGDGGGGAAEHARGARSSGGADVVLDSLEELPELLATRFDAAAVLKQQH